MFGQGLPYIGAQSGKFFILSLSCSRSGGVHRLLEKRCVWLQKFGDEPIGSRNELIGRFEETAYVIKIAWSLPGHFVDKYVPDFI